MVHLTFAHNSTTDENDMSTTSSENNDASLYSLSRSFKSKVTLPPIHRCAKADNILIQNTLQCQAKSTGKMFARRWKKKMRTVVLTKRGRLLVYDEPEKGFILDLATADSLCVKMKKGKSAKQAKKDSLHELPRPNATATVKFSFGLLHLHLSDNEPEKFRNALVWAYDEALSRASRKLQAATSIHCCEHSSSTEETVSKRNDEISEDYESEGGRETETETIKEGEDRAIIRETKSENNTVHTPTGNPHFTTVIEKPLRKQNSMLRKTHKVVHSPPKDEETSSISDLFSRRKLIKDPAKSVRTGYFPVSTLTRKFEKRIASIGASRSAKQSAQTSGNATLKNANAVHQGRSAGIEQPRTRHFSKAFLFIQPEPIVIEQSQNSMRSSKRLVYSLSDGQLASSPSRRCPLQRYRIVVNSADTDLTNSSEA